MSGCCACHTVRCGSVQCALQGPSCNVQRGGGRSRGVEGIVGRWPVHGGDLPVTGAEPAQQGSSAWHAVAGQMVEQRWSQGFWVCGAGPASVRSCQALAAGSSPLQGVAGGDGAASGHCTQRRPASQHAIACCVTMIQTPAACGLQRHDGAEQLCGAYMAESCKQLQFLVG
jgi:hypothetical protein